MKVKAFIRIMGLLALSITIFSCAPQFEEFTIYDTSTGSTISLPMMAEVLVNYDAVIFGEYHGSEVIHVLQADLLPYYLEAAQNIAISMEMFERDIQDVLDSYLAGEIDEEVFLSQARPWPNYMTDYKPIIEFAREEQISVIAANVPRRYAASVSRHGLDYLEEVPEVERDFLAREVILTDDEYKEKFFSTMMATAHVDDIYDDEFQQRLENFYAAQSLKDDTMAESIVDYREDNPETKIIHFTGDFHSTERLGMVTKIAKRSPEIRVATISPVIVSNKESFEFYEELRNIADFVIVIKESNND